ncbi:MAG: hypothetical protein ACK55Z_34615, partial [bacterium]
QFYFPNRLSYARVASAPAEAPGPLQGSDSCETTCNKLFTINTSKRKKKKEKRTAKNTTKLPSQNITQQIPTADIQPPRKQTAN